MSLSKEITSKMGKKFLKPELLDAKVVKILKVINKLKIKGDSLLDVGCADGNLTIILKEFLQSTMTFGIEISQQRAEIARTRGIKVVQMDIEETTFPFDDSSFDVILCTEILEHLYNPSHLLSETFRCLKPGGSCIIVIPNLASWHSRLLLLFGYQPYSMPISPQFHDLGVIVKGSWESGEHLSEGGKEHVRLMTLRGIRELSTLHKFQIRSVIGIPTSGNWLRTPFRQVFQLTENLACKFPGFSSFILEVLVKPC
ncbi:MAG: class I SAM-dependent methyltransferase [Atribacterota bacterium]|nr:class I SAM-dependent methyltransferase [Atribacterota bacterium]